MLPIRLHRLYRFALILVAFIASRAISSTLSDMLNPGNPDSGGMCIPSVTAPPCAQGDTAGMASMEPTLNLGIGNPVHLATGAKHQFDVDLPASTAHPDLEIVRHYNSMRATDSPLGTGWRFSYDVRVVLHQGVAQIEQANGARIVFDHRHPDRHGTLRRQSSSWQWVWPNGRVLDFDARGDLIRITSQTGDAVTDIVRHRGRLAPAIAHVRSSTASLQFSYTLVHGRAQLTTIHSPAGRFTYQLEAIPDPVMGMTFDVTSDTTMDTTADTATVKKPDNGTRTPSSAIRLTTVTRPDGMQRLYLYEADYQSGNATLPTGVVLVQPADKDRRARRLRISAWDYDAAGRAIGVSWGERTHKDGYSRIRYLRVATTMRDGITRVNGPAGQTRFTITLRAGQPRLLKVEGAGCPGCAAPGTLARYDGEGRLLSINGMRIDRDASGQPIAIEPHALGWPGLRMTFSATGARRQWQSTLTGMESVQDHAATRTAVRQFANGDRMDVRYDTKGRPVHIQESLGRSSTERPTSTSNADRDVITTTLQWHHDHLRCLQHPFVTETRTHDAQGRLHTRTEVRRLSTTPSTRDTSVSCAAAHDNTAPRDMHWPFRERFTYDPQGRVITHVLPEGGAVHYTWGVGNQLRAMDWEDAAGQRHAVIAHVANAAGYRYGNGLHLVAAHDNASHMSLTLHDATGARWRQIRQQNSQGHVLRETFQMRVDTQDPNAWTLLEDWRYAYDPQHRMIGAQQTADEAHWLAWYPDGALAAITSPWEHSAKSVMRTVATSRRNATDITATSARFNTSQPSIARDASGLPSTLDAFTLHYGANRRLRAVQRHGETLARYTHNAYGQRIRTQSGDSATDYLYLNNRLVAETAPASHHATPRIARRYLYAHHVPVGMIVYHAEKPHGALYAIHADLLGAPRMVTDAQGAVRWLATYTPFGQAHRIAGDMRLDMRLPGQWFDPATELHDNLLRTYAPQWGQYLEPDPIGPVPGHQALGYAAQQPRRFVDPLGLLLFAFDGTRHNQRTNSNVMKFLQHYQDGTAYYHNGPGNPYRLDRDAIVAFSAPRILEAQWFNLLTALKQANTSPWMRDAHTGKIPIDVVGFSRGAALARHFGNLIVTQTHNGLFSYQHATLGFISACVDLRFMGLLDSVAQFGLGGAKNQDYNLVVADTWRWVSHAVALHAYQGYFPLSSLQGSPNAHAIEAPFIGAHGDIGGGNLLDPKDTPRQGDLSNVALNWLWWQAQAAGVAVKPLKNKDRQVHDARVNSPLDLNRPASISQPDRAILGAQGTLLHVHQDDAAHIGNRQRDAVKSLIRAERQPNHRIDHRVDMTGYRAWLQQTLGWEVQSLDIPRLDIPQ